MDDVKKDSTEEVSKTIDKATAAPEPADCAPGKYQLVIAYTCTCGKAIGVSDPSLVQIALNNGALRVKHDCGQWWFLTPKFQIRAQGPGGNGGGPNRQARRAAAVQLKRSPGGILVPR